jgi:hypothetical protein
MTCMYLHCMLHCSEREVKETGEGGCTQRAIDLHNPLTSQLSAHGGKWGADGCRVATLVCTLTGSSGREQPCPTKLQSAKSPENQSPPIVHVHGGAAVAGMYSANGHHGEQHRTHASPCPLMPALAAPYRPPNPRSGLAAAHSEPGSSSIRHDIGLFSALLTLTRAAHCRPETPRSNPV